MTTETLCRCMQMPAFQYDVLRVESTWSKDDVDHSTIIRMRIRCRNCKNEFWLKPEGRLL